MFIYTNSSNQTELLLYVDDNILTASSTTLKNELRKLSLEFEIIELGPLTYFLGIHVTRTKNNMFLHERKYAEEIIKHAKLEMLKPIATSVDPNSKLNII